MAFQRNQRKLAGRKKKKNVRIILGVTWHKIEIYQARKRTTLLKSLRKMTGEWQRSYLRSSFEKKRILGTLSRLEEIFLNPLISRHSGTTPETSLDALGTNQRTNQDDFQIDLHPEVSVSQSLNTRSTGSDDDLELVTGVPEEITCCSSVTSSGKQNKTRSASQLQFCSEIPLATIEADQILLVFQQLASNTNFAIFNCNIQRNYKLTTSLTTKTPTFDGKTEKFELFEDLFQWSLNIQIQLIDADQINYFPFLMKGDALQTFENINSPNLKNLREILVVFP